MTADKDTTAWRKRAERATDRIAELLANQHALRVMIANLRDEIADRANVEADLQAQLAEAKAEADMWANR